MGSGVGWDAYGASSLKSDIEGRAGLSSANTAADSWSGLASIAMAGGWRSAADPPVRADRLTGTVHRVGFPGTRPAGAASYYVDGVAAGREELVVLIKDDGGGYGPGSMALQVAPEDLLAAAESFEAAANKARVWIMQNSQDLAVQAAGRDVVSTNVAGWLTDNAHGAMGAVPAVRLAVANLRAAAEQMRATAATYGITESASIADITAATT